MRRVSVLWQLALSCRDTDFHRQISDDVFMKSCGGVLLAAAFFTSLREEGMPKVAIYNTFRVEAYAEELADVASAEEAARWASYIKEKACGYYIVGGGSNVLFTKDFDGVVLHPTDTSLEVVSEDSRQVTLRVGAGVEWDSLVAYSCEKGWWGLENLSGIPGSVGASPVQNIGAYGASCSDALKSVHGYSLAEQREVRYDAAELDLGYRWSKFKREFAGIVIILAAEFRLSKLPRPRTSYGRLPEVLHGEGELTPQRVREAVLHIRDEKLPRVEEIGSAGSFFKNPEITPEAYEKLQERFPSVPAYDIAGGKKKVPAGWIIEHCGWRGKRKGDVQIYPKQALIIVNVGAATGEEIDAFAHEVRDDIHRQTGLRLEREVNYVQPYYL